jgi:hypothetical protein
MATIKYRKLQDCHFEGAFFATEKSLIYNGVQISLHRSPSDTPTIRGGTPGIRNDHHKCILFSTIKRKEIILRKTK